MVNKNNNEWVRLKEYPNFEVNRKGQLRNAKSGNIVTPHRHSKTGHVYYQMIDKNGISKAPHIDLLVAETFMSEKGIPTNTEIIHLDGNASNCSVDNLAWADEKYYAEQYYKETGIRKPAEYFVFYPLMEFPDSIYEINKMGQLRNKKTLKLLNGGMKDGYRTYTIFINKKMLFRNAHILVAKQFIPNPYNKTIVNHIDENRANPCIDNLEWVTPTENSLHGTAVNKGNLGRNKPVNEYDIHGKYIRTWKSIKILSDFINKAYPGGKTIDTIKNTLTHNMSGNPCKSVFADRVFLYYNGNCEDIQLQIKESKRTKYHHYTLIGVEVPNEYLYDETDKSNHVYILKRLKESNIGLTKLQRQAIDYAIHCINTVEKIRKK